VHGDLVLLHQVRDALIELLGHGTAARDDLIDLEAGLDRFEPVGIGVLDLVKDLGRAINALVGMQPQLRQMPPRFSRSTIAVLRPSWAARIAAT
jgi:hypothetical protein